MPPSRNIPLYQPTGMDNSSQGGGPWEILVNIAPDADGWRSLPGMVRTQYNANGGVYRGHCVFNSAGFQYILRLTSYPPNRVIFATYDKEGNETASANYSGSADLLMALQTTERVSFAALNSRAFFPVYGTGNVYAATEKTDSEVTGSYFVGDLKIGAVTFRAGIQAVNWPYVIGNFRARGAAVHLSRVFYFGFNKGEVLQFNNSISADQRYLMPDLVAGETTVAVNGQCLVWTDPDDPFAIGLPNFRQIPTQYDIVGVASFRGALIIFTEGDVWAMVGNSESEFSLRQVAPNIGCQDFSTVAVSPRGVYFANGNGIFITDGETAAKISDPVDYLFEHGMSCPANSQAGVPFQFSRTHGPMAYWPLRSEVWIPIRTVPGYTVTAGLVCDMTHALVYNENLAAWSVWVAPPLGSAESVPRLFLKSGLVPVGSSAIAFCDEQGTYNAHALWFREDMGGLELRSTLTRHAQYIYLGTKPLLVDTSTERFFSGVDMVWRLAPSGQGIDSSTTLTPSYNTVLIRGEEYDYDGEVNQTSMVFQGIPEYVLSAQKLGVGKLGTMKLHGKSTFHWQAAIDVRSRYARVFIKGRSLGPMHLRGVGLLLKEINGPGDRE